MPTTLPTAEEVRQCFNDGFLALFFPGLQSEQGQEYLLHLSGYALSCAGGKVIAQHCPDVFCCWASHYIAWLLASWGKAEIAEDGSVCLTDPAACQPAVFLSKKQVGGKNCEWSQYDFKKSCCDCPVQAVTDWENRWRSIMDACLTVQGGLFITGGSWQPCPPKMCRPCCGADWWLY